MKERRTLRYPAWYPFLPSTYSFSDDHRLPTFKMPTLDVSDLNVTISILGAFIVLFGLFSIKIKRSWYLGEARASHLPMHRGPQNS